MPPLEIPQVVIARLPIYYRLVTRMEGDGESVVSSQELGEALGVTPAQIRKDLSYFGRFGKQGRGYSVQRLTDELRLILGLNRRWKMVLIGSGRLGRAIASYRGFEPQGFDIVGIYDADPGVVGTVVGARTVLDVRLLDADLREDPPHIGIVAVPAEHAQEVIDTLVGGGVGAILNYAPRAVQVPKGVLLRQIDPVIALQSMTYHLRQQTESGPASDTRVASGGNG